MISLSSRNATAAAVFGGVTAHYHRRLARIDGGGTRRTGGGKR